MKEQVYKTSSVLHSTFIVVDGAKEDNNWHVITGNPCKETDDPNIPFRV